jgi:hypothetical protein
MLTAVPPLTQPALNVYVSVFEASEIEPPDGTPDTLVTVGVPAVPTGTLIVTELSDAPVAVVNEYP